MKRRLVIVLIVLTVPVLAQKASMTNFSAGEITPRAFGRTDTQQFYWGVRLLENMFVKPLGPVEKRPGTYYVAAAAGQARVIGFDRAVGAGLVLEFSNESIAFYKDN
ncbi:MAG: hypothetical protein V3W44_04255 [Dehalococcoidales bacterium]